MVLNTTFNISLPHTHSQDKMNQAPLNPSTGNSGNMMQRQEAVPAEELCQPNRQPHEPLLRQAQSPQEQVHLYVSIIEVE